MEINLLLRIGKLFLFIRREIPMTSLRGKKVISSRKTVGIKIMIRVIRIDNLMWWMIIQGNLGLLPFLLAHILFLLLTNPPRMAIILEVDKQESKP